MWIVIYIPIYTHLIKSEDEVIYYDKIHRWLDNLIESGKITNLKFKSAIVPDWFFDQNAFFFVMTFHPYCVLFQFSFNSLKIEWILLVLNEVESTLSKTIMTRSHWNSYLGKLDEKVECNYYYNKNLSFYVNINFFANKNAIFSDQANIALLRRER